jgi:RNA polymerase-binding transcription factor DksA
MTKRKIDERRKKLRDLAIRLGGDISALEDQARMPTGGQAVGNLSNAPMHPGDVGTEVYLQELNATLLENEEYLRGEVMAALERIDRGEYGHCENCGKKIIEERLDLLPYARHCTPCAERLQSGPGVNLNEGRPRDPADAYDERAEARIQGTGAISQDIGVDSGILTGGSRRDRADRHVVETAVGGKKRRGRIVTGENPDLSESA